MAVKIIKEGTKLDHTDYIYKYTCPTCGCLFEFELEDCISDRRLGWINRVVVCPQCSNDVALPPINTLVRRKKSNYGEV